MIPGLTSGQHFLGLLTTMGQLVYVNRPTWDALEIPDPADLTKPIWESAWCSASTKTTENVTAAFEKAAAGETSSWLGTHETSDGWQVEVEYQLVPIHTGTEVMSLALEGREVAPGRSSPMWDQFQRKARRSQFFVDNAAEAIYWLRDDSRFASVNKAACAMLGYAETELLRKRAIDVDPAYSLEVWHQFWQEMREQQFKQFETSHRRADGSTVDVLASIYFYDFEGEEFIVGVTQDITLRKKQEQQIQEYLTRMKESEKRLLAVADINAPCWITEASGECSWLNRQWLAYCGRSMEDEIGYGWIETVHPEDREPTRQIYLQAVERREDFQLEYRLRRHDGHYRLHCAVGRLRLTEEGQFDGFTGYSVDIHDQRLAEEALRTRNAELQHANEELEQFAYIASHDLRSPLRGMANLASFIREDEAETLSEASFGYLDSLKRRANSMERLLDDLLTYSRAGQKKGQPEMVDTATLIQEVIEFLPQKENFGIHVHPQMPTFQTNPTPLRQVFQNLINNALKHHHGDHGRVEISAKDVGEFFEFRVSDDGPGIDPQFHEKVFGMFQRLEHNDETEGSGMGLAIVRRLVRNYGGEVTLESRLGAGTTFYFTWQKTP